MIEALGKYVGSKVLASVLGLAAVLVVIWYWRLAPADRAALWGMTRGTLLWLAFVAILPWAFFFVPAKIVRAEKNWISGLALLGYLAVDAGFALYLTSGHIGAGWQRGALAVGLLVAAVYNFAVCEFLAQRCEDSL
jgi:hypothetical protein